MTLPDQLTAAEFERLKAQEQRMLNSGSWVPQAEDRLTAQVNEAAADAAAPDMMTAGEADAAEAQQSVMAETAFGRSVGVRPDYSEPPAKDPAEDEPKTIGELRKRQQDLYNDPTYDMPFEEWQDFTRWQRQNESEVGSFIGGLPGMAQSLGQLGVGLVKERAQQAYRATAGLDPIGAATTEVATFKEMGRKIGVGLTQLSDWVGGKVNDIVESGRRVGQVQQNVIQALRDNGQLTGDPIQDNTTIQKALEEAAAQGMYEATQQQTEEDDEIGYQRYLRKKSYDRDYSGITEFSIGGNRMTLPEVKKTATNPVTGQVEQPQEATATVGAMALSPENALPIGVGVLARARMLRRLASVTGTPLRATETAMASVDDWLARTADRVTSKIPFVGDLPLNQRAYALGAAGGVGAYLDATTDSPVIDVIAKPLIVAGLVLPAAKAAGGTIRRVGAGAGAGWQIIKEMDAGAVGSARAETAARMAASGKFNPRYSKYMERGAAGGVESTLRRVSQNPEMPETLRRVARSADNIGITQLARGIDDAVSSSVAAGIAATPFALVAPDSETAGNIVGGAVLLGGTLGTAGRVLGRRSARTDADIARMMVDVEMAGGDAGSLGALSYSGLDLLAAMQGITSGKVDFVPLRAQEYRANADVRASGGETVAGLHIEKAADGRAKVYVNMGHTAPIAGRVSIKPVQITRNGKTEDANVVRIKGADGESDFTVVPREYPLLVKSGDIVEPNARLARGLSPTHVMPHEIGHAILTSSILNGAIRNDLRNLINQRYDTPGVEARGREYVTRIVDKDILAGAHDQLPDKLTQQEFDDISSGRRTMADVLKGKPVSDAQREQMITDRYNEMRERSIAEGNNPDGLDVFRDEIVAETFSSLSDSLDFRRMRTGGPQVMESVLAATTRVFETLGMKFDRSTGKPLDNPSVVFRDNPLMKDPIMRKRMQEHLRNYEAWMLGMEQAGAREQKGTQISVDGSAESARRSTHTKLRSNDNGVLENDLIYIDQNGQAQWKPQKMLDEQEKGRSAQVGQLYDKNKILSPNSAEFGLRRAGVGRTVISGPTLPAKFDVLRWFPKHIREMARMLEAGRDGGASHIFDYNTIGTGEGGRYRVINRGDVRAIIREGAFLGWEATKNGHLKAVVMDLNAFRSAAMRAINRGELGIFNNDMGQLHDDLMIYLANHKNGMPGEATIGQQKRDMLNGLIGTGTAVQRDINPLYADLNPRGSVRGFRFDRINDITPTGRDGYHFDYDKIKNNRMPDAPRAIPQSGQAMPDAVPVKSMETDRLLREYEENQGYLGLSTLGMREGRPVKGGAAETRRLLARNTEISRELDARGVKTEDVQLQRALAARGQAMPDVADAPPFYLKSTQALDAKIQGKAATADQIKAILTNPQNGIKAEELKWTGVMQEVERLSKENNGKVPKEALLKYLAEDGVVRLEEVELGQSSRESRMRGQARQDLIDNGVANPTDAQIAAQLEDFWPEYDDGGREIGGAKYAQYQLPGGENYREVVLAMPEPKNQFYSSFDQYFRAEFGEMAEPNHFLYSASKQQAQQKWDASGGQMPVSDFAGARVGRSTGSYTSSHFDTPNYIAHMRLNERVDAKGKAGLFIEELQSDRHQQGREKGYIGDKPNDPIDTTGWTAIISPLDNKYWKVFDNEGKSLGVLERRYAVNAKEAIAEAARIRNDTLASAGIPDAPFRTSWPLQLFKRALRDAVDSGKEWIGWTDGVTQVDRYTEALRQRVRSIEWTREDGLTVVDVQPTQGNRIYLPVKDGKIYRTADQQSLVGKDLSEVIGKEAASKVNEASSGKLTGENLTIGGEGMKGFYDTMVPKEVAKYVKQWGGQVEKQRMGREPSKKFTDAVAKFEEAKRKYGATSQQATEAMMAIPNESGGPGVADYWRVNITPQMREGIKKAGQALFAGGVAAVVAEDQLDQ